MGNEAKLKITLII